MQLIWLVHLIQILDKSVDFKLAESFEFYSHNVQAWWHYGTGLPVAATALFRFLAARVGSRSRTSARVLSACFASMYARAASVGLASDFAEAPKVFARCAWSRQLCVCLRSQSRVRADTVGPRSRRPSGKMLATRCTCLFKAWPTAFFRGRVWQ